MNTAISGDTAPDSSRARRRGIAYLQATVAFFLALRLAYAITVPPNGDEAYYWLWGGHLQWSYFDHSPMVGWLSAFGRAVFGWTPAGLHLPAILTFLVLVWSLHKAARLFAPSDPERYFWLTLATISASPLLSVLTTLNYPDHALICFSALTLLYLGRYLTGALRNVEDYRHLYFGAFFLGLAGLSKYNAVFIPAALVVVLIAVPALRRLFRSPHLYLAGTLTFAMTLPIFIWNAQHRFASLQYHGSTRFDVTGESIDLRSLLLVSLVSVLVFSPFLVPALVRFLFGKTPAGPASGYVLLGRWTALIGFLFFLPLALWGGSSRQVSVHWIVLSFLPLMLVIPLYLRSRLLLALHLLWGGLILTLATIYYLFAPLPTDALGIRDGEATVTFGHEQVAAAVHRQAQAHGAELFGSTNYPRAARLAFAMGTQDGLIDFERRADQIQSWNGGPEDAGKDAIIVIPSGTTHGPFAGRFESVELLEVVQAIRFGSPLQAYDLLLGRGYKPVQAP